MTLKEILELIDKVSSSGISSLEVERAGMRIRIKGKKSPSMSVPAAQPPGPAQAYSTSTIQQEHAPQGSAPETGEEPVDPSWHIITSPIVGTFYRTPNPESDPFTNPGDRVEKGSVLCIVEAMKLMNEIESDRAGVVAKIYPQNGQPVEYGEKLFAIQP
ncbi:MAG TPA: acetyl-CoA carboxylase biotin carboxyl carrier protein [Thermoanaerobaculia bacterium]|nr:acetyl-CoA carboxylase biotin carboxyl carrier protein [Thermoanaerobaculia bacterium]